MPITTGSIVPTDTVSSSTKLSLKAIMMSDKSGKGGTNTLKCRLKNNDDWVTIIGLKEGVIYPFEIDYIADTATNVQNLRGFKG